MRVDHLEFVRFHGLGFKDFVSSLPLGFRVQGLRFKGVGRVSFLQLAAFVLGDHALGVMFHGSLCTFGFYSLKSA